MQTHLEVSSKNILGVKSGKKYKRGFARPGRVGAQSGLGPGPGWGPYGPIWALMGPYGPIWTLMGPPGQVLEDYVIFP